MTLAKYHLDQVWRNILVSDEPSRTQSLIQRLGGELLKEVHLTAVHNPHHQSSQVTEDQVQYYHVIATYSTTFGARASTHEATTT